MDRSGYDEKRQKLLDDKETYENVSKSTFKRIEPELNHPLQKFKREQKIDQSTYKKLHSTDAIPSAIRGSVKHHKQATHFDLSSLVETQHFRTRRDTFQTYFLHYKTTMVFLLTTLPSLQRNFTEPKLTKTKSWSHST